MKLKDRILRLYKAGIIHIFLGTFFLKVVSFFGTTFLVHMLSKEEFGILGYMENIYGYAFVLAGMGLSNAILRYVVLGKNLEEKYSYFILSCKYGMIWNLFLSLITGFISSLFPHPAAYAPHIGLIAVLLTGLPFQYICDCVLCNERAMFANQRYVALSLCVSITAIAGKMFGAGIWGMYGSVLGQAAAYVILSVICFYASKQSYYQEVRVVSLPLKKKKEAALYAFQYMITNGLWAVFMLNDTFLLGRFCAPGVIANYKVAYTIPGSLTFISSSLGLFISPYFIRHETNRAWIKRYFLYTYGITACFVGTGCLIIGILSPILIRVLYGEQYLDIVNIMRILLIAAFFNCGLRYTTANILASMGKIRYNMLFSAMGMIIQIGMNVLLIPRYGAEGVAFTSCAVYFFMAVGLLVVFYKEYWK